MRIAVFGTGGVGGYFGGRLAQAGEDVVFIARGEHLRALRTHGLKVESLKGDFLVQPAQAAEDPAEVGFVDAVLVGVKAWQVTEAADRLRPLVGPETFVVPLQNGVEAPAELSAVLGFGHVLGGLCSIISFIAGPGHVRHVGAEPSIAFGEQDNRRSERAERLRQAFARAEVTVEIPRDIHVAMWEKFLFIASWGGVGAVTRAPVGVVRGLPETREMMEEAMREILHLGQARRVGLSDESMRKGIAFVDGLQPGATASMQRDIMEGRPSELEAQNGAVVRLGRAAGIPTPVHAFIYRSLLPSELRARGQLKS
ncbi:MAG: 2-dehydropantoate 2-reductase [candidate division NC10 bacterium]|nr:2-dehydropantoate 2-reductase [candidate division NC10 bacterium]